MNIILKTAAMAASLIFLQPVSSLAADTATSAGATSMSFDSLDKNHDGFLSPSELRNAGKTVEMKKIDTNGDGRIDRSEFSAFEASEAPATGSMKNPQQSPGTSGTAPSGGAY